MHIFTDYEPDYDAMWDELMLLDAEAVFYATHEQISAHSVGRKVPNLGVVQPTNRATTPDNSPEPAAAKADEKG